MTNLLVTIRPTDLILTDSPLHNLSLLFLHLESIYLEQNYINKRKKSIGNTKQAKMYVNAILLNVHFLFLHGIFSVINGLVLI